MKYALIILALIGLTVSSLALREHYREYGDAPCDINEKWDCGIVNHSPYAVIKGFPIAIIGMAGYILIAILALRRQYIFILLGALAGLAYSVYLANIEAHVLGVWCVYCVASLVSISLITAVSLAAVATKFLRERHA